MKERDGGDRFEGTDETGISPGDLKAIRKFVREEVREGRQAAIRQDPKLAIRLAQDLQLHGVYFWSRMAKQVTRTWGRNVVIYLGAGVETGASLIADIRHNLHRLRPGRGSS